MRPVSEAREEMGHAAEDDEGNELADDPVVRGRHVGAADEVEELNWDGEVRDCD